MQLQFARRDSNEGGRVGIGARWWDGGGGKFDHHGTCVEQYEAGRAKFIQRQRRDTGGTETIGQSNSVVHVGLHVW